VEVQGNEKGATECCCNSHYSIDEQSLHQEILGCTSGTQVTSKRNIIFKILKFTCETAQMQKVVSNMVMEKL